MRNAGIWAGLCGLSLLLVCAADWPTQNGGPERNGWARSEHILTKANIKGLRELYAYRAENVAGGLTAPIINGNLITYRGFKEMLIFGARPDRVFSVDADLHKTIWDTTLAHKESAPAGPGKPGCAADASGPVAMAGSSSGTMHFAALASRLPAVPGKPAPRRSPYFPPLWQTLYPMRPETLTQLAVVYTVSSDGYLHVLNSSTGADLIAPVKFVPPHARVTSLNVWQTMVYATTADNCDGYRNALYGVNLLTNEKRVLVFAPEIGGFAGSLGTAIGRDGTVYVQVYLPADRMGHYRESVVALSPRELNVLETFSPAREEVKAEEIESGGVTPIVFSWQGKQMVAAAMRDGRIYLLDAKSLGGADHHTALFTSDVIAVRGRKPQTSGFRGVFSTWQNVDTEERWLYLAMDGPVAKKAHISGMQQAPQTGSIVAMKLSVANGQTSFAPLWVSRELAKPSAVVVANGMLFTVANGDQPVLYVLDALSGAELYRSGKNIPGSVEGGGLAVANGRVYFSTSENTVYCFGLPSANIQLAEDEQ